MRYGEIIQKAWKITWRYKFLWILAIFAGVTGPGGGGGGGGGSMPSMPSGSDSSSSNPFGHGAFPGSGDAQFIIGLLIAIGLIWLILALVWVVISISARAGLIWAVDQVESGTVPRLGPAWRVGFSRFWRMLGMGILVGIPMLVVVLILIVGVVVPIVLAASKGEQFIGGAVASVCGVLLISVPLLLVLGFILGIVVPVAERAIVLEDARVMDSLRRGWWAFRRRFKDSALMWLINLGLSWAASIVLIIPIVIVSIVFLGPAIIAAVSGSWGTALGVGGVWLLVILAVSLFFAAVWGTFTSALWTIFFRRLVGKEALPPSPEDYVNAPPYAPGGPFGAPPPYTPQPPVAPSVYPQAGPPMAPQPSVAPQPPAGFGSPMTAPPPEAPQPPGAFAPPMAPQPPLTPQPPANPQPSAPEPPATPEPPVQEGPPPNA
jgi:hypothetical protein